MHRRDRLEEMARALESAPAADRDLDARLFAVAGGAAHHGTRTVALLSRGLDRTTFRELMGESIPCYTSLLDAALPEENIVATVFLPDQGRWAAVHRDPARRDYIGRAATEALARRAATLAAMIAAQDRQDDAPDPEARAPERVDDGRAAWRVTF